MKLFIRTITLTKSKVKVGARAERPPDPKEGGERNHQASPTKESIMVQIRVMPESLLCRSYKDWCGYDGKNPKGWLCIREKGHIGPHLSGMGLSFNEVDPNIIEPFPPLWNIKVWE